MTNIEQLYALDDYYNASSGLVGQLTQEELTNKEFVILQNVNRIPSGIMDLLDDVMGRCLLIFYYVVRRPPAGRQGIINKLFFRRF